MTAGMENDNGQSTNIADPEPARWYLAIVLFLLSFEMGFVWNLFNAISGISGRLLGIGAQSIEYDAMIGCAVSVVLSPFVAHWISKGHFRAMMILSALCLCLGSWIILLGVNRDQCGVIFLGLALNGLAGPMALFGGAFLSDAWFPVHQRTQATSILCLSNYIGAGFAFFVGAVIVPETDGINNVIYLVLTCAFTASIILGSILIFFPSSPASPASYSQLVRIREMKVSSKLSFRESYGKVLSNGSFCRACVCFGLGSGIYAGWGGALNENLSQYGMGQTISGWIGSAGLLGGFIGGSAAATIVDHGQMRLQKVTTVLFAISFLGFSAFIVGCESRWPPALLIIISAIVGGGVNGTVPILFELALETSFPAPSTAAGTLLTMMNGIAAIVYFLIPLNIFGTRWMNWVPCVACLISFVLLAFRPIRCRRSECDRHQGEILLLTDGDDLP
uniref:Major facilitator superfamily (MFS) profile domain-containing protein n=1 Tax=Spongospora subterranea TaxID=70186 RepID=A0A0H5RA80_9EUKA|eukprot:CRZ10582.1 hypothetical protein [Spongospora subterranea]